MISKELGIGQKEIHISELSASNIHATTENVKKIPTHFFYYLASKGRAFLLETGCMKDWHNSGWKCPNYIYQWLFEVGKVCLTHLFHFSFWHE